MTRGPPRASPSASSHSAGGLNRAVEERAVIKLEGQVELILFPRGTSSQHLDWRRVPICFWEHRIILETFAPPSFPSLPSSLRLSLGVFYLLALALWCCPDWTTSAAVWRSERRQRSDVGRTRRALQRLA